MTSGMLRVDTQRLAHIGRELTALPSRTGLSRCVTPTTFSTGTRALDAVLVGQSRQLHDAVALTSSVIGELGATLTFTGRTLETADHRSATALEIS